MSPTLVITCAHVVGDCHSGPSGKVKIIFQKDASERDAIVLEGAWSDASSQDIAVLEFADLPTGCQPARLGRTKGIDGHNYLTVGYPSISKIIPYLESRGTIYQSFSNAISHRLIQLSTKEIEVGFSGAPLVDVVTERVVGMVNSFPSPNKHPRLVETAFATPSEDLLSVVHKVDITVDLHIPILVERYLKVLDAYASRLPYLTLYDIHPRKTIDEVYVPLRVHPRPKGRDTSTKTSEEEREYYSITEVIHDSGQKNLLILGGPGAGKSTLLKQLAKRAWYTPGKIGLHIPFLPLFVPLTQLTETNTFSEGTLSHALNSELGVDFIPLDFLHMWHVQTERPWLICADGLDEIPTKKHDQIIGLLRQLLQNNPASRLVISSRPTGYLEGELDELEVSVYEILPLTDRQTKRLIDKWFADETEGFLLELNRVHADRLRETPLLLGLAAVVYRKERQLPRSRSQLYEQFIKIWYEENNADLQTPLDALRGPVDLQLKRLGQLALGLTLRIDGYDRYSKEESVPSDFGTVSSIIATHLENREGFPAIQAASYAKQFIDVMARRSGVFSRYANEYRFVHPTFREYLCAVALADTYNPTRKKTWELIILDCLQNNWREILLFYLSHLSDRGVDITKMLFRIWQLTFKDVVKMFRQIGGDSFSHFTSMWFRKSSEEQRGRTWSLNSPIFSVEDRRHLVVLALGEGVQVDLHIRDMFVEKFVSEFRGHWLTPSYVDTLGQVIESGPALIALKTAGKQGDPHAAEKLADLGYQDDAVEVWRSLAKEDWRSGLYKQYAADGLEQLGYTDEAAAILIELVQNFERDGEEQIRSARRIARLGRIPEAAQTLLDIAKGKSPYGHERIWAAETLGEIGASGQQKEAWVAMANDKNLDYRVRTEAAVNLKRLGYTDDYFEVCLNLTNDPNFGDSNCMSYAQILKDAGYKTELFPTLRRIAFSPGRSILSARFSAIQMLVEFGEEKDARLALIQAANDRTNEQYDRERSLELLGRIGDPIQEGPSINELMQNTDDINIRAYAAICLVNLGIADDATPILLDIITDQNRDIHIRIDSATAMLMTVHFKVAVEALISIAQDEKIDGYYRVRSAQALSRSGHLEMAITVFEQVGQNQATPIPERVMAAHWLILWGRRESSREILLNCANFVRSNVEKSKAKNQLFGRFFELREIIEILIRYDFGKDVTLLLLSILRDQRFKNDVIENITEYLDQGVFSQEGTMVIRECIIQMQSQVEVSKITRELKDWELASDAETIARIITYWFKEWYRLIIQYLEKYGIDAAIDDLQSLPSEYLDKEMFQEVRQAIIAIRSRQTKEE